MASSRGEAEGPAFARETISRSAVFNTLPVLFFGSLEYIRITRSANALVLGFKSFACSLILLPLAFSLQPSAFSL